MKEMIMLKFCKYVDYTFIYNHYLQSLFRTGKTQDDAKIILYLVKFDYLSRLL